MIDDDEVIGRPVPPHGSGGGQGSTIFPVDFVADVDGEPMMQFRGPTRNATLQLGNGRPIDVVVPTAGGLLVIQPGDVMLSGICEPTPPILHRGNRKARRRAEAIARKSPYVSIEDLAPDAPLSSFNPLKRKRGR